MLGVRVVVLGPLDTTTLGALTTQAPDLARNLRAGDNLIMVISGPMTNS
jgi:hypothetical protein